MLILKVLFITTLFNTFYYPGIPLPNRSINQDQQIIYALNEVSSSNIVKKGQEIPWGPLKRVQSSYVLMRKQNDGTIYLQVTIGGQFAYGGYFKYLDKDEAYFKYIRSDETGKEDYLFVNYSLNVLSQSQKYDESVVMKMINYQTSYALYLKF